MIIQGDARKLPLRDGTVQCVVTSPPYYGLRDYKSGTWVGGDSDHAHDRRLARGGRGGSGSPGKQTPGSFPRSFPAKVCGCGARFVDNQIGHEETVEEYVAAIVEVFREVRRVLRDDGTVWLVIGDCYAGLGKGGQSAAKRSANWQPEYANHGNVPPGFKAKDLLLIPFRVAIALHADGWWMRDDVIWFKPNVMPDPAGDRPTRAHEFVLFLTKSANYFCDMVAVRESSAGNGHPSRNKRDVWIVPTEQREEAHTGIYPQELIEPCVLAGTSERGCCSECGAPRERVLKKTAILDRPNSGSVRGGIPSAFRALGGPQQGQRSVAVETVGWRPSCVHVDAPTRPCLVLDPFLGSGTTLEVCNRLGRRCAGVELAPAYMPMIKNRGAQLGFVLKGKEAAE